MTINRIRKAFHHPNPTTDLTSFVASPLEYLDNMKKPGVHVDELFLRATANVLDIDIFIVPFHPETAATLPGVYTRIDGGIFLRREEEVGVNVPVFLAYFKETHFSL